MSADAYCEFCGWEGSEDVVACPKGCGYKGLIRMRDRFDSPDLDAKIASWIADNPDWHTREP